MISTELQILIIAIKVVLKDTHLEEFTSLVNQEKVNWERLNKLVVYHKLRPILYDASRKIGFTNSFFEEIGAFSKKQAIKNQNEIAESVNVLSLMQKDGIKALPYKGLLFLDKLYDNKPIRQISDTDLLVQEKDAIKALSLLINDGYKLSFEGLPTDSFLKEIIDRVPNREVGLDKLSKHGLNVHLDFHWHLNEAPQYNINIKDFFEDAVIGDFHGHQLLIPSPISMFKMLLNHHGSRDCWIRLKDLTDLLSFVKSYPGIELKVLIEEAEGMNMKKSFLTGISLINEHFETEIKPKQFTFKDEAKLKRRIIGMWEFALYWDRIIPKILKIRIYKSMQDGNLSWYQILKNDISRHSRVNPAENKRIVTFRDEWVYLNVFSKFISYLRRVYF